MFTPQFAEPGAKDGFGLGFMLGDLDGHRRIGHGGAIYGFSTELATLPEEKLGVIVVANTRRDQRGDDAARRPHPATSCWPAQGRKAAAEARIEPQPLPTGTWPGRLAGRYGEEPPDRADRIGRQALPFAAARRVRVRGADDWQRLSCSTARLGNAARLPVPTATNAPTAASERLVTRADPTGAPPPEPPANGAA